jgi:hypothetical protein
MVGCLPIATTLGSPLPWCLRTPYPIHMKYMIFCTRGMSDLYILNNLHLRSQIPPTHRTNLVQIKPSLKSPPNQTEPQHTPFNPLATYPDPMRSPSSLMRFHPLLDYSAIVFSFTGLWLRCRYVRLLDPLHATALVEAMRHQSTGQVFKSPSPPHVRHWQPPCHPPSTSCMAPTSTTSPFPTSY